MMFILFSVMFSELEEFTIECRKAINFSEEKYFLL